MKSNQLFYREPSKPESVMPITPVSTAIARSDWRDKYKAAPNLTSYRLEDSSDDSELNRAIQLKNFENTNIIEGKPGRLYYDKTNKKVKIFISEADGWKDISYT